MKVVQVTTRYPPAIGGVETHVYNLTKQLLTNGIDVTVLTTDALRTKPLERMAQSANPADEGGAKVYRFHPYEVLPLRQGLGIVYPAMISHLKDADVIHVHGYGRFQTFVATFRRVFRAPVVITTHSDLGRPSFRKSLFDAAVSPITVRRADLVIAITKHEKMVLERLGVAPDAIRVIPNGVNFEEFSTPPRKQTDGRTILYLGRIDFDQKGVDVLVRALSLLSVSDNPPRLRLVGPDWGDLARVNQLAKDLGVTSLIEYLGNLPTSKVHKTLKEADVLAVPSRFEPFGIVILEAMASGLPVVASDVGGIPEIIQDGIDGLLAPPGDAEGLARQLTRAMEDKTFTSNLTAKALVKARGYSWRGIAVRTIAAYQDAVRTRR